MHATTPDTATLLSLLRDGCTALLCGRCVYDDDDGECARDAHGLLRLLLLHHARRHRVPLASDDNAHGACKALSPPRQQQHDDSDNRGAVTARRSRHASAPRPRRCATARKAQQQQHHVALVVLQQLQQQLRDCARDVTTTTSARQQAHDNNAAVRRRVRDARALLQLHGMACVLHAASTTAAAATATTQAHSDTACVVVVMATAPSRRTHPAAAAASLSSCERASLHLWLAWRQRRVCDARCHAAAVATTPSCTPRRSEARTHRTREGACDDVTAQRTATTWRRACDCRDDDRCCDGVVLPSTQALRLWWARHSDAAATRWRRGRRVRVVLLQSLDVDDDDSAHLVALLRRAVRVQLVVVQRRVHEAVRARLHACSDRRRDDGVCVLDRLGASRMRALALHSQLPLFAHVHELALYAAAAVTTPAAARTTLRRRVCIAPCVATATRTVWQPHGDNDERAHDALRLCIDAPRHAPQRARSTSATSSRDGAAASTLHNDAAHMRGACRRHTALDAWQSLLEHAAVRAMTLLLLLSLSPCDAAAAWSARDALLDARDTLALLAQLVCML